jgi:hypothetical protein
VAWGWATDAVCVAVCEGSTTAGGNGCALFWAHDANTKANISGARKNLRGFMSSP